MEARKPAAASAARSRSASLCGGPKSRSVPAISSTKAHAVSSLASSMRGENCAAHSRNTVRAAASPRAGSRQQLQSGDALGFKARHAQSCAAQPRLLVQCADRLLRRAAVQHRHRLSTAGRAASAARPARGTPRRRRRRRVRAHARISTSHAACACHVEAGGLRVPISMGVKRSRRPRTANLKPRSTVSPAVITCCWAHSSTTAALDCA